MRVLLRVAHDGPLKVRSNPPELAQRAKRVDQQDGSVRAGSGCPAHAWGTRRSRRCTAGKHRDMLVYPDYDLCPPYPIMSAGRYYRPRVPLEASLHEFRWSTTGIAPRHYTLRTFGKRRATVCPCTESRSMYLTLASSREHSTMVTLG